MCIPFRYSQATTTKEQNKGKYDNLYSILSTWHFYFSNFPFGCIYKSSDRCLDFVNVRAWIVFQYILELISAKLGRTMPNLIKTRLFNKTDLRPDTMK